jgi:hypothetical protein
MLRRLDERVGPLTALTCAAGDNRHHDNREECCGEGDSKGYGKTEPARPHEIVEHECLQGVDGCVPSCAKTDNPSLLAARALTLVCLL